MILCLLVKWIIRQWRSSLSLKTRLMGVLATDAWWLCWFHVPPIVLPVADSSHPFTWWLGPPVLMKSLILVEGTCAGGMGACCTDSRFWGKWRWCSGGIAKVDGLRESVRGDWWARGALWFESKYCSLVLTYPLVNRESAKYWVRIGAWLCWPHSWLWVRAFRSTLADGGRDWCLSLGKKSEILATEEESWNKPKLFWFCCWYCG